MTPCCRSTSIASAPNRVNVLVAIGGLLPGLRASSTRAVRVIAMTGPAALPTAVEVDETTARDRINDRPSERWDLILVDVDRHPGGMRRRRLGRTIILAVTGKRIAKSDATVHCL